MISSIKKSYRGKLEFFTTCLYSISNPQPFRQSRHYIVGCHNVGNEMDPESTNAENRKDFLENGNLIKKFIDLIHKEQLVNKMDKSKKVVEFKHPKELEALLEVKPSDTGFKSMDEVEALMKNVIKYSVKTQHPYFYNQFYGGLDEVALTSSWLIEALNTAQHTFEAAPVFVLIERAVIQEVIQLFGWKSGDGIFSPGGSISNMYAYLLARHQKYPDIKENGLFGSKPLVMFASDQCHYSAKKAVQWMGLGTNQVESIKTDVNGIMIIDDLRDAIKRVRSQGRDPLIVHATAGGTVLGAIDPLDEIATICENEGLWMHVDACWGGSLILSQTSKKLLKGIERADSIAWNPHKLLCMPMQCSPFIVKHKNLLSNANRVGASYLFQQDKLYDVSYDTGDKSLQCGRKADGFKLWFTFKVHGYKNLGEKVDKAIHAAKYLEEQVKKRNEFISVISSHQAPNVCFWYIPPSMRNEQRSSDWWQKLGKVAPKIKSRMVLKGSLMIGYQPIENKGLVNFFRMILNIGPIPTEEDMDYVLNEIDRLGNDL